MTRSPFRLAATIAAGLLPLAAGAVGAILLAPVPALAVEPTESFAQRLEAAWRAELMAKAGKAAGAPAAAPVSPSGVATQDDAAGGCDGVINGGFGFHTNQDDKPWWHVDLGAVAALDRVVVYNRCTVSERAARLHVLLSDDGKAWKTVYQHDGTIFLGQTDGKPLVVPLSGAAARFVRVQAPERTWMHLDEIEVYAADDLKKNVALQKPADQSSAGQWARGKRRAAAPDRATAKPAAAIAPDAYAAAVRDVLEGGRLLAADLAAGGLDTAEFARQAGQIAAELDGLPADSDETKTLGLYFRARRAVRALALRNPLLAFEKLLLVRRGEKDLGLPANWQSNSSLKKTGYDNEIAVLTAFAGDGGQEPKLATLYRPEGGRFVGDVDLDFGAARLLFSMPDANGQWQLFELALRPDGAPAGPPQLIRTIAQPDVDNYDACYLPDGDIVFSSTAPFIGVPCVRGNSHVTNLYLLERATGGVRRLTFDQDHDWCPTVLPNGRVAYLRWEYSDLPHSNSRILFHMNPDGTGQMELYGSNSYWPNSLFYARPVPGHPSRLAGIVTGHHGVRRMGELVLLDPAVGRQEAEGAVQRIGGRGQPVEPIIRDRLVDASWPRFLHPWPLGSVSSRPEAATYLLTTCKPTASSPWGIYLVDTFDHFILLAEQDRYALLEPVPLVAQPAPPVLANKVDPQRKDAVVYLVDIYRGAGLTEVPRGTVKKLRLFTYHFSYHGVGGLLGVVGADGPWDVKRVLGTVPVEPDGSAVFRIPANTPIAVQPLDEHGQALQLMRSWFVGMPGEMVSCVGCHERLHEAPPVASSTALRRQPAEIEPWRGPERGFSFAREVQPVVDRHCLGCHSPEAGARFRPGRTPDLRGLPIQGWRSQHSGNGGHDSGKFSVGYVELCRFIRRPGIESDIHMLSPMEFHASTTELVQMLRKGHHGVRLGEEAWDRLLTWIDLNAPYHGTWHEAVGTQRTERQAERRREMMKLYAGIDADHEAVPAAPADQAQAAGAQPLLPPGEPPPAAGTVDCPGWPFDAAEARRRQEALGEAMRIVDLGDGVALELALIPPGEFIMGTGDPNAPSDERPAARIRIERPFWLGRFEVTNEQFARFDPLHDSRVEPKHGYQFGIHGYPVGGPRQPVVRVSWQQATAFCRWLTARTGGQVVFTLPTEAQWEYACRAGSAGPFAYGGLDVDFAKLANLGDAKLREFASNPYTVAEPMKNPNPFDDWLPKDERFNDGALVSADVGGYQPNAWGLHDLHGNVAEWTRTLYRPYPYTDDDGRSGPNGPTDDALRVVRGGSWYDRPTRCRSGFRLAYRPYQRVFNVGFRVATEVGGTTATVAATEAPRAQR